jgi:Reverse transcriptase (RNA-dependent DNA polymerase)
MDTYNAYMIVKRASIPTGRKCVKCKWVLDVKRNSVFRARLVACGYSQQPGVDFTESFSPVVNDSIFRCLIVIEMLFKLISKIIDIEVAFLNGHLEELIYMNTPPGVEVSDDECVLLQKSLYGLVQSARQFFKMFSAVLRQLGMMQSNIEPCVFHQETRLGILIVAVYVDDCYVIGTDAWLNKFIVDIQAAGFKIMIEDKPTDCLSCEIKFNSDKTCAWLGQPHLVKQLEKSFGILIKGNYNYLTPGTPSFSFVRPNLEADKISPEPQKVYRMAVSTLLQIVKHSRPDIANPVRELSKCMDGGRLRRHLKKCVVL